jgi:hypothetical protein
MSSKTPKNYKNAVRRLRKIKSFTENDRERKMRVNMYTNLEQDEEEFISDLHNEDENLSLCSQKPAFIDFDDLPEDMLNLILTFLSANTRLAILKNKYNKKYIQERLQTIPKTAKCLTKLWHCAIIAKNLIEVLAGTTIINNLSLALYTVKRYNKKNYSEYDNKVFTLIILAAIKHYTKIYKYGPYTNKKVIEHIEQMMLNMFRHISVLK